MIPCARFDDLTAGIERSFALRGLQRHVIARRIEDVVPALELVQETVAGGEFAAGFVAYDAAPALNPALDVHPAVLSDPFTHVPLVWFGIFERMESLAPFQARTVIPPPYHLSGWSPNVDVARFAADVRAIQERIDSGVVDQVTQSIRLRAAFGGDAYELYRDLAVAQRSAFCSYLDAGRYRILSAAPGRFFRLDGRELAVCPSKGTIRRGRWPAEDMMLAERLETSEAAAADHRIAVDEIRAELERLSGGGPLELHRSTELERFETVWQLGTTLRIRLDEAPSPLRVLQALFPSAVVTGSPKPAAMQAIAGIEEARRGIYGGAVGFLAPEGSGLPDASFSVAVRTVVVDQEEGLAEYGVGTGVTESSSAVGEFEEMRAKVQLLVERRTDFDLLETIRWDPETGFWLLGEHLDRMAASADYFGFEFDRDRVAKVVEQAVTDAIGPVRVKVQLDRSGDAWAVARALDGSRAFVVDGRSTASTEPPLRVVLDEEPVSSSNVFLFHKTSQRGPYERRAKAHPVADDVVLTNERGEVTESTVGNVVVDFHGSWWTPPLDSGLLDGIQRQWLIEQGIVKERAIAVSELASADRVAVVNSIDGWRDAVVALRDETIHLP